MLKVIIVLVVIIMVGILSLLFFALYGKIAYLLDKTKYADDLISKDLDTKYDLLVKINKTMKKTLHAKKDYLSGLNEFSSMELFNEEKDIKLTEYAETVSHLISDYTKLANHKEIKKETKNLYEINEKIDASKTYFNKNMTELSKLYTKFPTNIVSKLAHVKIKPLYQTNDSIKKISEEL